MKPFEGWATEPEKTARQEDKTRSLGPNLWLKVLLPALLCASLLLAWTRSRLRALPISSEELWQLQCAIFLPAALVLALFLGWLTLWVRRHIDAPIQAARRVADAWHQGDLQARIRLGSKGAVSRLGLVLDDVVENWERVFVDLRSKERRLHAVLEAMAEGVFVTDAHGRIEFSNRALNRLLGGQPKGRTIAEATRSARLQTIVSQALAGEHLSEEVRLFRPDSAPWLMVYVAPLAEGQGVVGIFHEVTRLKEAEKIRRDFVANASHELRTPLTAIRGFAETLRDGAVEEPALAKRFLGTLLDNAQRLENLVNDLFMLSKLEAPETRLELEYVDCASIAESVIRSLEAQAAAKQVKLVLDGDAHMDFTAFASSRALDQVLMNLVSNGIKYTAEGTAVKVALRRLAQGVQIEVSDQGPGIPLNKAKRIFERFYRIDRGRSRDAGGTGLGLSIVKQLMELMNGKIDVITDEPVGAIFRLTLPVAGSDTLPRSSVILRGDSQDIPRPT